MTSLLAIARYTFIEQIRNRLYLITLFFGAIILASSILVGELAPSHRVRVIFDLGLVSLELFGLATAVFGAVTLVLQEIESKTIYLLITRPLPRPVYILGRYLGLVLAVSFTMIVMALFHLGVMMYTPFWFRAFTEQLSFPFGSLYPMLVLMSIAKMLITTSIALFFSLFASSSVSALVFTGFFWIVGHFGPELSFMINRSVQGTSRYVVHAVTTVFPNFQYFNFRDAFDASGFSGMDWFSWALLYGLAYISISLILSSLLFSRKEF